MVVGGMLLGAGMVLNVAAGDYLYGSGPIRFMIETIVETRREWNADWVILTGQEQPTATTSWRPRRIQVRVSALAASLVLAET